MKKVAQDLYIYKGIYVKKLSNGMYSGSFYVNSVGGMCNIKGATQESYKKMFNQFITCNKGLNMKRYEQYLEHRKYI